MDLALSPIKQKESGQPGINANHGCRTIEGLSLVLEGYSSDEDDTIDEETQPLSCNRLKDFYYREMQCEFEGCNELAEFHCTDGDSFRQTCGKIHCKLHTHNPKKSDKDDNDSLASLCANCYAELKAEAFTWRCYTLLSFVTIIVSVFIIYKLAITFQWNLVKPEYLSGFARDFYGKSSSHISDLITKLQAQLTDLFKLPL